MGKYDSYFTRFNQVVEDLEKQIKLYYAPEITACPNCIVDTIGGVYHSTGIYILGGPIPFTDGYTCPYCDGRGIKEIFPTENVSGRIYRSNESMKYFKILLPDGAFLFLTKVSNLHKIRSATYAVPLDSTEETLGLKFQLLEYPSVTNFSLNPQKYIECKWTILK